MKFFLIVLESTWLQGTLRIKRSFRLAGNLPTVGNDWWSYDWGYRTLGRKEYLASRPKPPPKPSTGKPAPPRKPANVLD